jgi:hypothetical protein
MATESEQLKKARASGSLTDVIGVLRKEAKAEAAAESAPAREQLGVEDAAIRTASQLAMAGQKPGAERRSIFNDMKPGKTVTTQGVAKTTLSRQEKLDRVKAWGSKLTEEQRTSYLMSDEFDKLSDRQQELIGEGFSDLEEQALEASLGIENIDLDAPTPEVDDLIGEEGDSEDEVVDDSDFEALFNEASWETEQ